MTIVKASAPSCAEICCGSCHDPFL